MDGLSTIEQDSTWQIFVALAEMGPEAKEAVPAISAYLDSRDPLVRKRAAEALRHIETEGGPQASGTSPPVAAAVTDLGTITLNDHDWYQCTLSGARICRVRLTAIPNGQVVVEVVVLSQDAQGQPQRILARAQTETDPGRKVSLGIGEGSVALIPEVKLAAN